MGDHVLERKKGKKKGRKLYCVLKSGKKRKGGWKADDSEAEAAI